ncbi:MAG: cupin domain-containing protein [Chloroflexota bacterium]|nr:cupin domain-containing protein [Chloroflexota bacterium]
MTQESKSGARVRLDTAKALELSALVAYAEGAVVSRTIVDTKACTLTLFAFDSGQTLSEHTTPFDALVHVLDGVVELAIGGVPVRAAAGQVVLMPAGVPHAVRATARFKMLLTMVR